MRMRVRSARGEILASGKRPRFYVIAIVTLLVLLLSACTNEVLTGTEPERNGFNTFAGAVTEELFIGITTAAHPDDGVEQQALMAYLCDGDEVSVWFYEEFTGQEATLVYGNASIALTFTDDGISGTVAVAGANPQPFTAARVTTVALTAAETRPFKAGRATGDAGLYRAEETFDGIAHVGGWIILNDGRQRGAVTVDGEVVENPPLDTATGEAAFSRGTLTPSQWLPCPPYPFEFCRGNL